MWEWILPVVGIGLGTADFFSDREEIKKDQKANEDAYLNQRADLEQSLKDLNQTYADDKKAALESFTTNKEEAYKQAAHSDALMNNQEGYLGSEYRDYLSQFGIQMTQSNADANAAMISNAQNSGSNKAAAAVTGVRSNSSIMGAVGRQEAYAEKDLARQFSNLGKNNQYELNSTIRNMSQGIDSIREQRYQANETRNSYLEGGYQYQKYQQNLSSLDRSYNSSLTDLNAKIANTYGAGATYYDAVTGKTVTLKTTDFSLSDDAYKRKLDSMNTLTWLGYTTKGAVTGGNAYKYIFK